MMTIILGVIIYVAIGGVIARMYAGDQRKAGNLNRLDVDMGLIFIFWPLLLLFSLAARVIPRNR